MDVLSLVVTKKSAGKSSADFFILKVRSFFVLFPPIFYRYFDISQCRVGVSPRVLLITFFFSWAYAHPTSLTLQATFNRQTGKHHHAKQGALNLQWTF